MFLDLKIKIVPILTYKNYLSIIFSKKVLTKILIINIISEYLLSKIIFNYNNYETYSFNHMSFIRNMKRVS
jgi:hypothetical protein